MDPNEIELWKQSFFHNNLSVDQCLTEYTQKSDLETLRKELKNYGADLQLQMSDILKNETEAIVNLAEYLTNLNSKVDNLSVPISQLREEIKTLYDLLKAAESSYNTTLNSIKGNNSEQNHILLKLGLVTSSQYTMKAINMSELTLPENLLTLERIVNKYSFQKTYLEELNLISPDIEKVINTIESKLVDNINVRFLNALNEDNKETTIRCLRMYVDLQRHEEAHNVFQRHIIRPRLEALLTEKYLQQCNHDLSKIYDQIKEILLNRVEALTQLIRGDPNLTSFNFALKPLWREFDKQSREGLPHITAPGNPDLFQKRFIATYNLLEFIATCAGDKNLIKEDESFINHLKRFNLPVYFEIRFQQIAGNFENEAFNLSSSNMRASNNPNSFKLKPSVVLWNGLISCFNTDIYIDQLADQFVRFSMLLLSRYINLMEMYLNETATEGTDSFVVNVLTDFRILKDLIALRDLGSDSVSKSVYNIVNQDMWPILLKLFKVNNSVIQQAENTFKNHIIKLKVACCMAQLQNVTAIPRLYRRTNKSPPKEASSYVVEAVKPILVFANEFKANLGQECISIIDDIVIKITSQYLSLVKEVLMSVCKTEESLRRLKSRALNTSGDEVLAGSTGTMSDETKIREQIKYDVGYFYDKLQALALKPTKEIMDLLKNEVSC